MYPSLESIVEGMHITEASAEVIKEIQQILGVSVDGKVGPETLKAFTDFKEKRYLDYPDYIGVSTAQSLIVHAEKHVITEQLDNQPTKLIENAGTRTGKSVTLPVVGLVYTNEFIVPDIPLTWGEMTKDFDPRRIPNTEDIVRNIRALAVVFGKARAKYGKPVGVNSGYRPAALRIGVRNSQHIPGRAIDTCPLNRGDLRQWHSILMATPEFTAVGDAVNKGFVHSDIRPSSGRGQIRFGY
ncbi:MULTISPECIES: D-Ala-D-Ala carboxypeptidase family metallohydrolase [unclassified Nodularia (in: cyanobacteria)]|uniref:D-Ala-D-Ala carboxypeptidase family metallohydrolase n=1 Tax=unclassified Nodularia (in: cyanobacteria) TaxID=2656917 RepID=UPI00187DFC62|nr:MULTISPECIES: D-Ala-D-Ala carboxypeptidase family metallohydrolase [unclassified Nodularia (in: cyanobacteria)]MBE9200750.1 hypothetical protein [Nodularia sp. LEGE 06071]MCC2692069.1 hypothetical protein [Nodularia sp. LEGE 04288]